MSPKATILIVDDEPDVREVLEEYFVTQGYAAIGAESASVARTVAAAQQNADKFHACARAPSASAPPSA